jgi:hypothetical protein
MRIHSDILTRDDLFAAIGAVRADAPDIYLEHASAHGSRSRTRAFEVALRGMGARHTRRPNFGGDGYAATYHDWGYWIAELFAIDHDAVIGPYKGADDFERQTPKMTPERKGSPWGPKVQPLTPAFPVRRA